MIDKFFESIFKKSVQQLGRIGVLMGGYSSEREISLKSGKAIFDALSQQGCYVMGLDIVDRDQYRIAKFISDAHIDVAFIALHGELGEDGKIQFILEEIDLPYTGSGAEASLRALDKIVAHNIFSKNGIPIPEHISISQSDVIVPGEIIEKVGSLPIVVKPAKEGSSIGVYIVRQEDEIVPAVNAAGNYGQHVLIEKYIEGRELTVGILGHKALPVVEICPNRDFFDYTAKYQKGLTDFIVPAKISSKVKGQLQEIALKAHRSLGCHDLSRVDFMLDSDQKPYVLEVNTIPGFTATSLLPKAARECGINFDQLCIKLVELAYGKKKKTQGKALHC